MPVGIDATGMRRERDRSGAADIAADRYWGAATQRSLNAWGAALADASPDRLPDRFHRSYGTVKKAVAAAGLQAGCLPPWKAAAIGRAADDLIAGQLDGHFPLPLWQSGFGRETDTNVNEVLANRAIQLLGGTIGSRKPVDPRQDLGGHRGTALGASGCFMTALNLAAILEIERTLLPGAAALVRMLDRRAMTGHAGRMHDAIRRLDEAEGSIHEIVVEPDAEPDAAPETTLASRRRIAAAIAAETGRPFIAPTEPRAEHGAPDAIVSVMAAVREVAIVLLDLADALRSEPHAAGAPSEAAAMICLKALGLDQVATAAAGRAMRPLLAASALTAIRTLGVGCAPVRAALSRAG